MLGLLLLLAPAHAVPTWTSIQAATGWEQIDVAKTDVGPVAIEELTLDEIRCFRASTEAHVARARLVEVALDVESVPKWTTAGVTTSEVLARGENTLDYWQYLDLPAWTLAKDRLWFQRLTWLADGPSTDVVHWDALPAGGPHAEAFKRVHDAFPSAIEPRVNVGGWVFTGEAPVRISYQLCTGEGGALPKIVEEAARRQALPNTVADFVREAKRRDGFSGS